MTTTAMTDKHKPTSCTRMSGRIGAEGVCRDGGMIGKPKRTCHWKADDACNQSDDGLSFPWSSPYS
jgi:hypothetical protein